MLSGYTTPEDRTVTVVAGQTVSASFTLEPIVTTGSIVVTSSPAGASIILDGNDSGYVTPYILTNVSPGIHQVVATLSGYATPDEKTITVVAGSTASIGFKLSSTTGSIRVGSNPEGARIYIDNVDAGRVTPYTLTAITPGSHHVRVTLAGYTDSPTKTVAVTADRTMSTTFSLNLRVRDAGSTCKYLDVGGTPGPSEDRDTATRSG